MSRLARALAFVLPGDRPSDFQQHYESVDMYPKAVDPAVQLAEVQRRLGTADVDRGIGATALIDHVPHDSAPGSTS